MSGSISSFLFINVSRIGDTLFATPAMRAVAAAYPGCHITALAHPKRAEVLQGLPFVARVGGITKKTDRVNDFLSGGIRPLDLSEQQISDLVAFMEALTSPEHAKAVKTGKK